MGETRQRAAGDDTSIQGTSAPAAAKRWSMLPDDLLRLVHARLVGPVDGARFAAVCASWRAIVPALPSRLPWLILDPSGNDKAKHVYCLADDTILPRIPFPSEAVGRCFVGSYGGGWVVPSDAPLRIVNLFSRAQVLLSTQQKKVRIVNQFTSPDGAPSCIARRKYTPSRLGTGDQLHPLKMIFSGPPTSSSCVVAAITDERDVAICGPGHPEREWTRRRYDGDVVLDITFCNGHLYCLLGYTKQLVKCEVSLTEFGVAAFGPNQWLAMPNRYSLMEGKSDPHDTYILELSGKLVMAVRRIRRPWPRPCNIRRPLFLVFELVHADADEATTHHSYKWEEIKSLGDHALFLGPTCAKAMPLVSTDEHGDLRRNCIYYSHNHGYVEKRRGNGPKGVERFFTSSNCDRCSVYYKEYESIDNVVVEGITSVGYCMSGDTHPPMWLLPPNL